MGRHVIGITIWNRCHIPFGLPDLFSLQVLVFCTTARVTALFAELYKKMGMNTLEIHSRKSQSFRTKVSDEFRKHEGGVIMFTSDVSARGVDYPDVTLVLQVIHLPSALNHLEANLYLTILQWSLSALLVPEQYQRLLGCHIPYFRWYCSVV